MILMSIGTIRRISPLVGTINLGGTANPGLRMAMMEPHGPKMVLLRTGRGHTIHRGMTMAPEVTRMFQIFRQLKREPNRILEIKGRPRRGNPCLACPHLQCQRELLGQQPPLALVLRCLVLAKECAVQELQRAILARSLAVLRRPSQNPCLIQTLYQNS